jgi:hypothetical protein
VSPQLLSPAWKQFPELIPRARAQDYLLSLEIMDRKKARAVWRDGIKSCWDHRCAYCDGTPIDDRSLTLDHVRPKKSGGQDLTRNLVPACADCNTDKGSQNWRAWFREQSFYCSIREEEIASWMRTSDRHAEPFWDVGIGNPWGLTGALQGAPRAA